MEVTNIQKMQDEIAAVEAAMKQYGADASTYKNFTKEKTEIIPELVDCPHHNTLCAKCTHVCHDGCSLRETTTKGDQIFKGCWAIKNDVCVQCPNKCSYTEHYHARKTVKVTQKKMQEVLYEIKAKYDAASKNKDDAQTKIKTTADAKRLLEKALKQKNDEIKQKCTELQQICTGFNIVDELYALINILQMESSTLRNIDAKQQAEDFIRSLRDFCDQLEKDGVSAKRVPRPMNLLDTYVPVPITTVQQTVVRHNPTQTQYIPNTFNMNSNNSDSTDSVLRKVLNMQKRGKTSKSSDDSDKSENEIASSDSDDEVEEKDIRQKGKRTLQNKATVVTNKNSRTQSTVVAKASLTPEQTSMMTTAELVTKQGESPDQRTSILINQELNKRCQGKSIGQLTPIDIAKFTRYTQKYTQNDQTSLNSVYNEFQNKINSITDADSSQILKVPSDLLLEIAAVYLALQDAPSTVPEKKQSLNQQPPYGQLPPQQADNQYLPSLDQYNNRMNPNMHHGHYLHHPPNYSGDMYQHHGDYPPPPPNQQNFTVYRDPNQQQRLHNTMDPNRRGAEEVYPAPRVFMPMPMPTPSFAQMNIGTQLLSQPSSRHPPQRNDIVLSKRSNTSLIELYYNRQDYRDQYEMNRIQDELKSRLNGEAFGPLSYDQVQNYNKSRDQRSSMQLDELKYTYDRIKEKIALITDNDPLRIMEVSVDLLLQACALCSLIQQKSKSGDQRTTASVALSDREGSPFRPINQHTDDELSNTSLSKLLTLYNDRNHPNKTLIQQEIDHRCIEHADIVRQYPSVFDQIVDECRYKPIGELQTYYFSFKPRITQQIDIDSKNRLIVQQAAIAYLIQQKQ
ncbi:unnamed protein product [Didymodactylos carnosus]|uniref:Uncharacterized protein n=1 Tax=Didymodactylos carnosus TaxID=1234261 RepID=A0A8S2GTC5_9BILA|nr:unnamed protein product [Didymodactylos carnosus]CAF3558125.1 unnamed protein product [Didymodactylos carnosus]